MRASAFALIMEEMGKVLETEWMVGIGD